MAAGTAAAALVLAGGAYSAYSSIKSGNQQAKAYSQQAEYNAQIYDQQAEMIQQKKKIQDYQANRQIARMKSSIVSKTAGKGLMLSGSPLAVMADTESQMLFDKAIGDYNLDIERNFAMSSASQTRYAGANQAKLSKAQGYSNAFTTLLNTGTNFAIMRGFGMPSGKL